MNFRRRHSELRGRLKSAFFGVLTQAGLDRLCRFLNRDKLLVLMYHGVTGRDYHPSFWTQLPVERFREQMTFLRCNYRVIKLEQFLAALTRGERLPERAALVTFDDGFKNNLTVAYPVLAELDLPASIFIATDFIGSGKLLWFDELYLLIQEGGRRGLMLPLRGEGAAQLYREGALWEAYCSCAEAVKRIGSEAREGFLAQLRQLVPMERWPFMEDFGPLDWHDVRQMERSGLISFGVHTATHRILTELTDSELRAEVVPPRERFLRELGRPAETFCYPNGNPGLDFMKEHETFLKECGYLCAFSTESGLFDISRGNPMNVSRIAAGNDVTSDPSFFRLNVSGALQLRRWLRRRV